MIGEKLRNFFIQIGQTTINGLLLYLLNRNKDQVLNKKFPLGFLFIYGAIVGSLRVLIQIPLYNVQNFFRLDREIFMNMIVFPFFITVCASVLLDVSARSLRGTGNFRIIVNYIFYANTFHLIIPFIDYIFNNLLSFPDTFDYGFWGYCNTTQTWLCLFTREVTGLTAGIIFMYVLLIIRTPSMVRSTYNLSLKRSILSTCSLFFMFWVIFLATPFWLNFLRIFPVREDNYTFVFIICTLVAFPYFWKKFRTNQNSEGNLKMINDTRE